VSAGEGPPPDAARPGIASFWDRNPHRFEDPEFWMAHPLCRRAINERVSGSPDTWPLDHLYLRAGAPRFGRLLSLGCGTGRVERAVRRLGIADEVEGLDASPVSIDLARRHAQEEGLSGIRYSVADLNRLSLRGRHADAVVFHQSLHHVAAVEGLMEEVRACLAPGGFLFLEEWTGPSRTEWSEERLAPYRALFREVPEKWRRTSDLQPPIETDDPTEAVRSSAIVPTLRRLFRAIEFRPYGGQIVSILLPQLRRAAIPEDALNELVSRWLAIESAELAARPETSFHHAILATPRTGISSVFGRMANELRRSAFRGRIAGPSPLC
jgi:SAM-dependent methyltransferase